MYFILFGLFYFGWLLEASEVLLGELKHAAHLLAAAAAPEGEDLAPAPAGEDLAATPAG